MGSIIQSEQKPIVVHILGGPGAGKGTQCKNISDSLGFVHVPLGEILRAEVNKGTEVGLKIKSDIQNNKLVDSEIAVGLIEKAMKANGWNKSKFLIDGFPRDDLGYKTWNQMMSDKVDTRIVL